MHKRLTIKDTDLINQTKELWIKTFGDSPEYVDWYTRVRSGADNIFCYVRENRVLSMFHAVPYAMTSCGKDYNICCISAVATEKEYRGRGFASSLLDFANAELPVDALILKPKDTELIPFYQKCGFKMLCKCFRRSFANCHPTKKEKHAPDFEHIKRLYYTHAQRFPAYIALSDEQLRNMIAETLFPDTFIAYTDSAFAFCVDGECCDVLFVCGGFDETLLNEIFSLTDKNIVNVMLSEAQKDFSAVPFNMIKTDIQLPENVFSCLWW